MYVSTYEHEFGAVFLQRSSEYASRRLMPGANGTWPERDSAALE
jgi:hypothetical protein